MSDLTRTEGVIAHKDGILLIRDDGDDTARKDGRYRVVRYIKGDPIGSVQSVVPGDMPRDGGVFQADANARGVKYVSGTYTYSYARKTFRKLTK